MAAETSDERRTPLETLAQLFDEAVARHADAPLIGGARDGSWHWHSYREIAAEVAAVRGGLAKSGIGPGDVVALISDNRREWAAVAFACAGLGACLVPIYPALRPGDWRFIVEDSGAKLLICGSHHVYERAKELRAAVDGLERCISMSLSPSLADSYDSLLGNALASRDVDPESPAAILYTAGTTGNPKGVVLSHRSFCHNVSALSQTLPLSSSDRSLSFLPWTHAFGLTCELFTIIHAGASMALARSPERLLADCQSVGPTVFVSVPLIFNQIHDAAQRQLAAKPAAIRKLFERARSLHAEGAAGWRGRLELAAAERVVFRPLRHRLGGRVRFCFSGGAPLSSHVVELFELCGLPIYQGYGLTEAGPVVSLNRPDANRRGTCGRPLPGVEVMIDESRCDTAGHGEIVVQTPSRMLRYQGLPDDSAAALVDGQLRTGDVGKIEDGYLVVTGRLAEQYRLSNGKDITPEVIEKELELSRYIRRVMIHGEGLDHNVALVVVDVDMLSRWAGDRELTFGSTADMLASERVRRHIMAEIGERSAGLRAYERVRRIALIDESFSVENGLLTPTNRIRRQAVLARYGALFSELAGA